MGISVVVMGEDLGQSTKGNEWNGASQHCTSKGLGQEPLRDWVRGQAGQRHLGAGYRVRLAKGIPAVGKVEYWPGAPLQYGEGC
jgi:hypothetical protein